MVKCAMPRQYVRIPLEERFWNHVDKTSDCWIWTGPKRTTGYGQTHVWHKTRWKLEQAHRVAWELTNGPIPSGIFICHTCDVRLCVRPDHLFLGTARENTRDMVRKGRARGGRHIGAANYFAQHPEISRGERNGRAKLTEQQVTEIRQRRADGGTSQVELARQFGVSQGMISKIVRRDNWRS